MKNIYLDNSATTKPAKEVLEAMSAAGEKFWGNPSSIHTVGQEARKVLDEAREFVSSFVGCNPEEIIFTSGGTESDNLAIRGMVEASGKTKPHIITTAFEHHAILHTIEELEREGKIEASYVKPNKDGVLEVEDILSAVRENTVLISVMYVNNEVGTIQPISQIGEMLETLNKEREAKKLGRIYFHTDAVQAAEFCQLSPEYLKVDLLSISAHKFHGPRGVGVLFVKKGTPIKRQITGGSQEMKKRAGTENIAGICGLRAAMDLILKERDESSDEFKDSVIMNSNQAKRLIGLRDKLEDGLLNSLSNIVVNGKNALRAPHISNISFVNAEGEAIIIRLDFLGIAVSSGSACTSGSLDPSHVLLAMDIPAERAHGSIRFSLGRENTEEDIDKVLEVLPGIIETLREMSPLS